MLPVVMCKALNRELNPLQTEESVIFIGLDNYAVLMLTAKLNV